MNIQLGNPERELSVQEQYNLYLERIQLKEDDMHPSQKIEVKAAFYAAVGQIILLMRDDISKLPEEKGVEILNNMLQEITDHWIKLEMEQKAE